MDLVSSDFHLPFLALLQQVVDCLALAVEESARNAEVAEERPIVLLYAQLGVAKDQEELVVSY